MRPKLCLLRVICLETIECKVSFTYTMRIDDRAEASIGDHSSAQKWATENHTKVGRLSSLEL
jgi:hypothetical protein